jgi:predicted ArsR family transcriptional regulator
VAHGLRLKGFAVVPVLADVVGLAPPHVEQHLDELAAEGHAKYREGRISGWALTGEGRKLHHEACSAELEHSGAGARVSSAYRRFLELNAPLLAACTDWQLRSDAAAGAQVLNAHDDADYDRAVVARLAEIDERVQPIVAELTDALHRFEPYGRRLAAARARVEAGERDWFTGAMVESYHTVWFELHEDLLVTLGLERAAEPVA